MDDKTTLLFLVLAWVALTTGFLAGTLVLTLLAKTLQGLEDWVRRLYPGK